MVEPAPSLPKVWTEADFAGLPNDGYQYELVGGELVMSPKNNFYHGDICSRLLAALVNFNEPRRLGAVLDSSTGFWMNNRNCRAPDISFVSRERLRAARFRRRTNRFFPGAPDLVVEILSPHNSRREMTERLRDYFASGAQIAWVIDPEGETAEVCHSLTEPPQLLGREGLLDGEHLLPGFQLIVGSLFEDGDWE